jgi:site-specific DNA recombinase
VRRQIKRQLNEEPTAVLYLRVSTDEQAESGLGLEAQEARCRAYAAAQGWTVDRVYVDAGASAKTLERPELQKALVELQAGDVLIAYKLDRLTRTVADFPILFERVEKAGAELVTVEERFDTSTAMGRAMLNMALVFSQLERETTAERTSAALTAKRARGERLGATPLGYKTVGGELIVDEKEMKTVLRARELKSAGYSLREIGGILRDEGHRSKRGGAFGPSAVAKLLETRLADQITA